MPSWSKRYLDGLKLPEQRSTKLTKGQKRVQQIIGDLKYFERGYMPRITLKVHRLSCIMSDPPPEAEVCAESVLAEAFEHRHVPLTFHRSSTKRAYSDGKTTVDLSSGAPEPMECAADASTHPHRNLYAVLITTSAAPRWLHW